MCCVSSVLHSYLADQCWNGGVVFLIMLRRIKRKAPPPPCNGNGVSGGNGVTGRASERRGSTSSDAPGSPALNGKRTRKFGVTSRASVSRDDGIRDDRIRDDGIHDDGVHDDGVRDPELENGFPPSPSGDSSPSQDGPGGRGLAVDMPTGKGRLAGAGLTPGGGVPQGGRVPQHLQNGGTATLPTRSHTRLSESCQAESPSCETASQVTQNNNNDI